MPHACTRREIKSSIRGLFALNLVLNALKYDEGVFGSKVLDILYKHGIGAPVYDGEQYGCLPGSVDR
jgi:hypothetical protein